MELAAKEMMALAFTAVVFPEAKLCIKSCCPRDSQPAQSAIA